MNFLSLTSANRTPFWRGITLLQEWMRQGTITACASDNVRDPFYAYGDLNAFEVFLAALRIGHLDDDLPSAVSVVTFAPATLMGIDSHAGRIAPGMPACFVAFAATSFSNWLSQPTQARERIEL